MTHVRLSEEFAARFELPASIGYLVLPLLVLLGVVVVGFALRILSGSLLPSKASATRTRVDDMVAGALHGPLVLFSVLVGVAAAILFLPIPPWAHTLAERALMALLLLAAVVVGARLVSGLFLTYGAEMRLASSMQRFLRRIAVTTVYVVGILLVLDNVGITITPLLTTLGLAGLAVALAFQDTLANFFAGMYVQADKPLAAGHYVRFEDLKVEGTIVDVGWRTTKIRTKQNTLLVIPNTKVAAGVVVDYDMPDSTVRPQLTVQVARSAEPRRVEALLVEQARAAAQAFGDEVVRAPTARFSPGFTEKGFAFTVELELRSRASEDAVLEAIRHRIAARLRDEGIELV